MEKRRAECSVTVVECVVAAFLLSPPVSDASGPQQARCTVHDVASGEGELRPEVHVAALL